MKIKYSINIDKNKILKNRGMGSSNEMRKYIASEVKRLADPYTPFQQGMLKKPTTASDGSQIIYSGPYAHYQYYGKVMGGRPPKKYTGAKLKYNGAPMRGARWIERMLIDKRSEIENNVIKKFGG